MRKLILALALMSIAGCETLRPESRIIIRDEFIRSDPNNYLGYQPIEPLPAGTVMVYDPNIDDMQEVQWAALVGQGQIVRDLLPLQSAEVSVSRIDASGGVSYLTASLTGKIGTYMVIMDYMKYRVEDVYADESVETFIGNARVGVGLRIKAVVQTTEMGLNLGSLIAIGAEAQRGTLRGGIAVDVIGIDSPDVTNLIPLTSEIDQTSIQSALQALASIKTKIGEPKTRLTPHVLAIRQAKKEVKEQIKQRTSTAREIGFRRGLDNSKKKDVIMAHVAPNGTLNKARWDRLVEASILNDAIKSELEQFDDFARLNARLNTDVGLGGNIVPALYDRLGRR